MKKYILLVSLVLTGLVMSISHAAAVIVPLPSYADVVNTTSTAFAGSLMTDLVPWAGFVALITIVGIGLAAVIRRILGGFSKIAGGRRRGRGRRRR